MKIAIIADPLDNQRAGVHVYVRELVNALATADTLNEFVLIREKVDPELKLPQFAVPNVHLPVGYASFRLFVLLPRLLRKLGVDAVFEPAHFGPFNLPSRIKRITMIHDLTPIILPHFHRWHSQLLQRTFLGGILKRADLVLANSDSTANDLARIYPVTQDKTKIILLGKSERFKPVESRGFQAEYAIDTPYFLYVGTIEPRKNLQLLLSAYACFRKQSQGKTKLVIVGQKGWKSEQFFAALEQHSYREDILLTGYIKKEFLPEAYAHSLALVYPSVYEGFGFPVLEAFSCGTNVICPKNSSLPEVGGDLAYYYPTQDGKKLAELLLLIEKGGSEVSDRREKGPEWAANFSWEQYAREFDRTLFLMDAES